MEDALAADLAGEADAFEDFAQRAVGMGELQRDALLLEFLVQGAQGFRRGDVNVGDGLRIHQEPADRRGAGGDELAHALDEVAGSWRTAAAHRSDRQ